MIKHNILVVEDDPLIAEDIREIIEQLGHTVSGVAYNKEKAIQILDQKETSFAILDINLGDNLDGILIAEHINKHFDFPFIYLTSYANQLILDKIKHTLPMGYVVKPFEEAQLFTAINVATCNFDILAPNKTFSIHTVNSQLNNPLTEKEFAILNDLYLGKSNDEIAEKHFISVNTVKTHLKKLYEKLAVHSRTAAVAALCTLISRHQHPAS